MTVYGEHKDMKKVLMILAFLAVGAIADDSSNEQEFLNQQIKGLQEANQVFMKIVRENVEATPKKIEAFKKGERLFCKNQIVSSKKGWSLDGDLLIKDDRYYSLADCFLKSN